MHNLIEIENVSLSFKTSGQDFYLFENLNLTLATSLKKIALVGADGSGKSSFLKLLVGLLKPQQGKVKVQSPKISYMSQSLGLNEELSVKENLDFKLKINDENVDPKNLAYLLEKVDLKTRESAIKAIFTILESANIKTVDDFTEKSFSHLVTALKEFKNLQNDTRDAIFHFFKTLLVESNNYYRKYYRDNDNS